MNIKEVMNPSADMVSPDMTVYEAADKMLNENIGFLCVGENNQLQGTLTDRDIVVRAVARGMDLRDTKISEVLTPRLEYCDLENDLEEVARLMSKQQIRRLPVLDQNRNLVGVVSIGDLAQHINPQTAGEVLRGVTAEQRI